MTSAAEPLAPAPGLLRRSLRSSALRQTAIYAGSSALAGLLISVSNAVLARHLSSSAFGSFSFGVSFLKFTALFFEFGLFYPIARIASLSKGADGRRVSGAALITFAPVGLAYCLTAALFSFGVDSIFNVHAGTAILLTAPLAFVWPFRMLAVERKSL